MSTDKCGSTNTQTGDPCGRTDTYADGRCLYHTDDPEAEPPKLNREQKVNMRLAESTHARLQNHQRHGETLSGAVDRALDALEREAALPDAVSEVLRDGDA